MTIIEITSYDESSVVYLAYMKAAMDDGEEDNDEEEEEDDEGAGAAGAGADEVGGASRGIGSLEAELDELGVSDSDEDDEDDEDVEEYVVLPPPRKGKKVAFAEQVEVAKDASEEDEDEEESEEEEDDDEDEDDEDAMLARMMGRGLHSSTFQLNLSALYGIGSARRGCVARVTGVFGVCRVLSCDRHGSS
jgi:hypothetical protein